MRRGGLLVSGGGLLTFCLSLSLALNADCTCSFLLPFSPVVGCFRVGGAGVVVAAAAVAAVFKCFSYNCNS